MPKPDGSDSTGSIRFILPFPPQPRDAATIAAIIEKASIGELLPLARRSLEIAALRVDEQEHATGNAHAMFGAMLCLCRLLDEMAYPWDGPQCPTISAGGLA